MKERPILFSAPMVRALLDGSKTQTRRIIKVQPPTEARDAGLIFAPGQPHDGEWSWLDDVDLMESSLVGDDFRCPYGQTGDRLWVRESFWGCDLPGYGDTPCAVYDDEWHGKEYRPAEARPFARKFGRIPSIHMPRDCSRITLEIVLVRVERLNDCSEADAEAEGVIRGKDYWHRDDSHEDRFLTARDAYRALWEQINGPGSWDLNPWVWCISFRRITE